MAASTPQAVRQPRCRQIRKERQAEKGDLRAVCLALVAADRVGRRAEVCVSEISLMTIDNKPFTKAMRTEARLPFTKGLQGKLLKIGSMEVG